LKYLAKPACPGPWKRFAYFSDCWRCHRKAPSKGGPSIYANKKPPYSSYHIYKCLNVLVVAEEH